LPDPIVTYSSPDTTGALTLAPVATAPGSALVTVTVREADGDSFTQTFLVSIGEAGTVWQNPGNPRDVDNSGFIVPLDVLLIINELNNPKFRDVTGRLPLPPPEGSPPPYFDVNGDAHVTPLDVLIVINFLNSQPNSEGEASTEQSILDVNTAATRPIFVQGGPASVHHQLQLAADFFALRHVDAPQIDLTHPAPAEMAASARDRWFAGLADSEEDLRATHHMNKADFTLREQS
jgi:hypothetical protein